MSEETPKYKNPELNIETRVEDLLARMTLEEKVGQMLSGVPVEQVRDDVYTNELCMESAKRMVDEGIGQIGVIVRHASPRKGSEMANELQRYALEDSRLGIPVMIQDECVHGCKSRASTMFPMSIGLAASWSTDLMERVVHAIGKETSTRGIKQAFSPTLNIARDVRCGRTEETYGEDPYLVSRMGVAFIKTLQQYGIAASPKHFVANFVGDGGRDSHPVYFSERILREIYFPAFKAAVEEAGTKSIMIAHTAIDGLPCSNNPWLMNDVLRKEWGFDGFIVPDNTDVQKNFAVHSQADSYEQSSKWCVEAGLDTDLSWFAPAEQRLCYKDHLPELVESGEVDEKFINESCARILRSKFELGLFENPYVDPDYTDEITRCDEHRALARESANQSMTLLKNEGILPLSKTAIKKLAMIGPNSALTRLGGYTCDEAEEVTPLEGITAMVGENMEIRQTPGCPLDREDRSGFDEAVEMAKWADTIVLCMGNSSDKIIGQPEITEGERHDRCDLDLPGVQEELVLAVVEANPNTIVVLQGGSAVTMRKWVGKVNAILEAWYPGAEGGHAIADTLFGDSNPAGRLPITFPITTGQCPLYYNPRPHGRVHDYCDLRGKQEQFAFGHGLSYTEFAYSDLAITSSGEGEDLKVAVELNVKNTGECDGDEVVQLYTRDCFSRISQPLLELCRFKRITLGAGESKKVAFEIGFEELSFFDADMKRILEAGDFNIMVGAASDDIRLEKKMTV